MNALDDDFELRFVEGTLVLARVPRSIVVHGMRHIPWTWDDRIAAWRTDAIYYPQIVEFFRNQSVVLGDSVAEWMTIAWPATRLPELRADQRHAADAWLQTRRGQIIMPTGTGKTEVALAILARTATSTLIVAPVRDLMYQWHRRILERLGYDSGIIGDNCHQVRPVSVTTYDSACIHMERLGNQFGLLVFDECHHLAGNMRRDASLMSAAPYRLGLTATPERSDGRHVDLDWLIGPVQYRLEIEEVRGTTLAEYNVVRIPVQLSAEEDRRYREYSAIVRHYLAERRQEEPNYSWQDLCAETGSTPGARRALRAFHAKKSIEDRAGEKLRVLEDLFRLHADTPCIVFAGSNAMARDVSQRFLIPCLLSHCGKRERLEVLKGLEDGSYRALVANQVLDEGVDLPAVKVAVVLGGTASTRQAKQRLGRILRKTGSAKAVLYEIVCEDTNDVQRSRNRRRSDAYRGTKRGKSRQSPDNDVF